MVDALEEYDRKGIKTGHLPTKGGGELTPLFALFRSANPRSKNLDHLRCLINHQRTQNPIYSEIMSPLLPPQTRPNEARPDKTKPNYRETCWSLRFL